MILEYLRLLNIPSNLPEYVSFLGNISIVLEMVCREVVLVCVDVFKISVNFFIKKYNTNIKLNSINLRK